MRDNPSRPRGPRTSALGALMSGLELLPRESSGTRVFVNLEAAPAPIQGGYQMAYDTELACPTWVKPRGTNLNGSYSSHALVE